MVGCPGGPPETAVSPGQLAVTWPLATVTHLVRLVDGKWQCANCGELLDVPPDKTPVVVVVGAGGQPTMRTLIVDGDELHRCRLHRGRGMT